MDPITINRIAKIRQDEIVAAAARDKRGEPRQRNLFTWISSILQPPAQASQPQKAARHEQEFGCDPRCTLEQYQARP